MASQDKRPCSGGWGCGELVAVVKATEPPEPDSEADPPTELELRGMLIGATTPPEPDLTARRLLGNFTASLGEGATFPHLKGGTAPEDRRVSQAEFALAPGFEVSGGRPAR